MQSSFTPGPWHVANGVQIRSERHQVAKVWMMRNGEGTANARVIAAAPDMYEALKATTEALNEIREGGEYSGSTSIEDWPELQAAYAALAKAEGKS